MVTSSPATFSSPSTVRDAGSYAPTTPAPTSTQVATSGAANATAAFAAAALPQALQADASFWAYLFVAFVLGFASMAVLAGCLNYMRCGSRAIQRREEVVLAYRLYRENTEFANFKAWHAWRIKHPKAEAGAFSDWAEPTQSAAGSARSSAAASATPSPRPRESLERKTDKEARPAKRGNLTVSIKGPDTLAVRQAAYAPYSPGPHSAQARAAHAQAVAKHAHHRGASEVEFAVSGNEAVPDSADHFEEELDGASSVYAVDDEELSTGAARADVEDSV